MQNTLKNEMHDLSMCLCFTERGPPDAEARGRNHENGDVRLVDPEINVDPEQ